MILQKFLAWLFLVGKGNANTQYSYYAFTICLRMFYCSFIQQLSGVIIFMNQHFQFNRSAMTFRDLVFFKAFSPVANLFVNNTFSFSLVCCDFKFSLYLVQKKKVLIVGLAIMNEIKAVNQIDSKEHFYYLNVRFRKLKFIGWLC